MNQIPTKIISAVVPALVIATFTISPPLLPYQLNNIPEIRPYKQIPTSDTISSPSITIPSFLEEVFKSFSLPENKNMLHEIAESLSEWLINSPDEYQSFFAAYFKTALPEISCILMSVLSDAEFSTTNKNILNSASSSLKSDDKWLAQTAAIFLLTCGAEMGKKLLATSLSEEMTHSELIKGISKLLS